ncbi:GNAT family N-acetyltransferase [Burkholderia glumae]|uniref:GNAT family N-acetyltransferase n=1 Tax=Burkholderia glumae TaxID=337 RepID=A0AAQ0BUE5_BURGL|nr:GNAT family protein [Burkholderia glumae]ACR28805.1 putative GCN5-related N-acetyltransferase [Burkholderia glumae BGR1]AJY65416.1 acetyltransferase domain protein [Burkholderia glumae LMG 2196 = ATCC 33617]KHJ60625.1 GCN5 family acetyltransferase [Burkholderia glumae]MCM2483318.1 GNAT family N-acetyltransferase [Burkholderia glumae]MCM2493150.1 GNAT family N-acetyltransferase [Burkholderia glumae]
MTWNIPAILNTTLENEVVTLRRIGLDDKDGFARIAYDPQSWTYMVSVVHDEPSLVAFLERAIADSLAGTRVVFAIIDRKSGQFAGTSAFGNLAAADRRLEIGWSWLGAPYRGTAVNRAAKGLLLDYAFGELGCERVEFKTDVLNERARAGLRGIGATEEGVMRSFNFMPSGRRRDAVYYSILKSEWPDVRATRFR